MKATTGRRRRKSAKKTTCVKDDVVEIKVDDVVDVDIIN